MNEQTIYYTNYKQQISKHTTCDGNQ